MIHLYRWDNDNFDRNGDVILMPARCEITAEINAAWTLELQHPIDEEGRWKYIEVGAVLKTPSFNGTQFWRIVQTTKADAGITAVCDPIFFDSAQNVIYPEKITLTNKTPKQIIDTLAQGTSYQCESDITETATITFNNTNLISAIIGSNNGVTNSFDCEIGFDNYTIQIMSQLGEDNGASVLYGKNLQVDGITESVNIDGTVTRLIPIAYNNYKLPELYVDSPLIDQYSMPRVGFKVYENLRLYQDKVEGEEPDVDVQYFRTKAQLYEAMRAEAAKEFSENDLDKPTVNIEVSMVMLRLTEEYKDYKDLETVSIGDYVTCKHNRLGIEIKTRVRKLVYDCVLEDVIEVELGEPKRRYFDNVSSVVEAAAVAVRQDGSVVAERIEGTMDGSMAQMKVQNTTDSSKFARLIFVEDLNEGSPTYGAVSLGTPGLQLSNERENGDWKWETAVTPDGIIADLIKVGTLKGIEIKLGGSEDGTTGKDGVFELYDQDDNLIGTFDKNGFSIEKGTIRGTQFISSTGVGSNGTTIVNGVITNRGSGMAGDAIARLDTGELSLTYDEYNTVLGAHYLWMNDNSHSTVISAGDIRVNGHSGITDSITIGETTLEFECGILVGIS